MDWISIDFKLKFKNRSGHEFDLNSKEFENFDLIQRFMTMIREQVVGLNISDVIDA
jgi:hypothetical protein